MNDLERFMSRVDWTGARSRNGYGTFKVRDADWVRHTVSSHRFVYEALVGPIPEGLQIDHLCFVKHCVNPDHLEPVTPLVNTLRARERITHCPQGHPYSAENTRYVGNKRDCRTCRRKRDRERKRELRRMRAAA